MSKSIKNLIQAVQARGFYVSRVNQYVWKLNGAKMDIITFIVACREIIKKYSVKQSLRNAL